MAVIYRSDLDSINNFAESLLSQEVQDSEILINEINNFIAESSLALSGDVWNKVRTNLGNYTIALNQRKAVAGALSSAITSANGIMLAYLNDDIFGGSGYADDGELVEICWELNNAQSQINNLRYTMNSSDNTNNSGILREIAGYEATIANLEPIYEKLKQLAPTDNNAYSNYGSAEAAISNLENTASSINVSNVVIG